MKAGEVHAIMGPNGSGKSTLAAVLAGREGYEVSEARSPISAATSSRWRPTSGRAKGLFLAFQYPVEIPGVNNMYFLRTAINAQRRHRGEPELDAGQFLKIVRAKLKLLDIGRGSVAARHQCRVFRRREEAQRDLSDGDAGAARSPSSTRPTAASTSTP